MEDRIVVVTVPQLGVNELVAQVAKWYVADGTLVTSGQPCCAIETTKTVFDVEAEAAGYIAPLAEPGAEVKVSQPIALIGPTLEMVHAERGRHTIAHAGTAARDAGVQASEKAIAAACRFGVDLKTLAVTGIIREQDVLRHVRRARRTSPPPIALSLSGTRLPVIVYGAGRGAVTVKECLDLGGTYETACFVDDDPAHADMLAGRPVYDGDRLSEIKNHGVRHVACAVGDCAVRMRIIQQSDSLGLTVINVIHPQAFLAPSVTLGRGNYIKAGAVVDTNTRIGDGCIIDNGVVVAHDCVIGNGCHLAPGVQTGSGIDIGDLSVLSTGASVATGAKVGRRAIVSVGTAVTRDVPSNAVVEGVPGRQVGRRRDE